jgi:hypothetical protein
LLSPGNHTSVTSLHAIVAVLAQLWRMGDRQQRRQVLIR